MVRRVSRRPVATPAVTGTRELDAEALMTSDPDALRARARALLAGRLSRGELKRAGAEVDADPALRRAVLDEASRGPIALTDEDRAGPGKRLLRLARARSALAQVRTTPIARDEAFDCAHCGAAVAPHGRTARDHCPRCLRSLHVDVVPGDRAAGCGGLLDPIAVQGAMSAPRLLYRCRACGEQRVNRAILDGDDPDDWASIARVAAGEALP